MDPTLTLQIPFVLMGRNDLEKPTNWTGATPTAYCVRRICDFLRELCPSIPVWEDLDGQSCSHVSEGWAVRPGEPISSFFNFTVDHPTLWGYPVLLERRGIPIDDSPRHWRLFEKEIELVCSALSTACDIERPLPGKTVAGKWWSLICLPNQYLHVVLTSHATSVDGGSGLQLDLVQKLFIIIAGVEKEITMITTPSALLKYYPLSRFLEYQGIQETARVKRNLWKQLQKASPPFKRRKNAFVYTLEKQKWVRSFKDRDMEHEKRKKRTRECWDMVAEMDADDFARFIHGTIHFEEKVQGMCLSAKLCQCEENTEEAKMKAEDGPTGQPGPTKSSAAALNLDVRTLRNVTNIKSVVFHNYHSTLDPNELIAYISIIANIGRIAFEHSVNSLSTELESLQILTQSQPDNFLYGFERFLDMLHIVDPSRSFWRRQLTPLFTDPEYIANDPQNIHIRPDPRRDPFYPIHEHITSDKSRERKFIRTYIKRYDEVGGFRPTPGWKLYALMLQAEQDKRGDHNVKPYNGILSALDDVRVGEISHPQMPVMTPRRVPDLSELKIDQLTDKESWIKEWRSDVDDRMYRLLIHNKD